MLFPSRILTKPADNEMEICVFGPGYGESIVVYIPGVGWGIIDSCVTKIEGETIIPPLLYLLALLDPPYPPLSFVVLTHPHEDHYLGLNHIINEYPGGIERVCRYDGDGIRELKIFITKQRASNNNILPNLPQIFNSMDNAVKAGATLRRLGEITSIIDLSNTTIEGYGTTDIKLTALSPSAISVKKYIEKLFSLFPQIGKEVKPGDDKLHNMISVCLFLKIGTLQIIFGSDVESGTDDNTGWAGILSNRDCPDLWANFVKIAHHGAVSGYNTDAWTKHIKRGKPFSAITPFCKGKNSLPADEDINNYKSILNKIGITTSLILSEKIEEYYSRKVITAIKSKTKSFKIIKPHNKIGFIRYRFLLDGTVTEELAESPAKWI